MRCSELKSKTCTGKQTLVNSSDPTPAINMVGELGWVKGHMVGKTTPKAGDKSFEAR